MQSGLSPSSGELSACREEPLVLSRPVVLALGLSRRGQRREQAARWMDAPDADGKVVQPGHA